MPPLPPKPKVPPVVSRALVVATLSTSACPRPHTMEPVRIGEQELQQPPPVRIGAEACPGLTVVDAQGNGLAGVQIDLGDEVVTTGPHGYLEYPNHHRQARINHPGFEPLEFAIGCGTQVIRLTPIAATPPPEPSPPPPIEQRPTPIEKPPPRIGMPPDPS